jgi:hypothetical protein
MVLIGIREGFSLSLGTRLLSSHGAVEVVARNMVAGLHNHCLEEHTLLEYSCSGHLCHQLIHVSHQSGGGLALNITKCGTSNVHI